MTYTYTQNGRHHYSAGRSAHFYTHFYGFIISLAHMLRKMNSKTFFDSSKPLITSMCPFVGILRLSMILLLDFGVDIQGKGDFIPALKVIFVIFKVVNSFE